MDSLSGIGGASQRTEALHSAVLHGGLQCKGNSLHDGEYGKRSEEQAAQR